jgi:uncharacterized RDD family membrane protein YckC
MPVAATERRDEAPIDPVRLAGILWRRPVAYFVDIVIVWALSWIAFLLLSPLWAISLGALTGPILLVLAIIPVAYHTLLIGGARAATFGQRLLGIKVERLDGHRPTMGQAFLQTVLFYVTAPPTGGLILVVALFNQHRRTVHDYLAGTVTLRVSQGPDILPPGKAK